MAGQLVPAAASAGSAASPAAARSSVIKVPVFALPLTRVGRVNLGSLASAAHRRPVAALRQGSVISRQAANGKFRLVDNFILSRRPKGKATRAPTPATTRLSGA